MHPIVFCYWLLYTSRLPITVFILSFVFVVICIKKYHYYNNYMQKLCNYIVLYIVMIQLHNYDSHVHTHFCCVHIYL